MDARPTMRRWSRRDRSATRGGPGDPRREGGASMAEFVVVAPLLMLLGLGTVQAGLIYHAKTVLNYATFEAARTGAVHHARPEPMRRELGVRLAPLVGGDGSIESAARAIARSVVEVDSPLRADGRVRPPTRLRVLNPTAAAFEDWGVRSLEVADREVIPNDHLRHRSRGEIGAASGLSLADANLLRVEVVHAFDLQVPLVGTLIGTAMSALDPARAPYYAARALPLRSVATVRMQSEVWREAVERANAPPPAEGEPDALATPPNDRVDALADGGDREGDPHGGHGGDCTVAGLPGEPALLETSAYESGQCGVADIGGVPAFLRDEEDGDADGTTSDC